MIERHASRSGYLWTSYDFAGSRGNQNLFAFPLGPGPNGFQHDGGETIFSLPNGFQGYYLSSATGARIDKGPTTMVRDPSRKDSAVTTGISCMGCHDQGLRKARDEVRDIVLGSRTLPRDVRDKVEALHPPHARMDDADRDGQEAICRRDGARRPRSGAETQRRRADQCAGEALRGRRRSCAGRGRTRHRQIEDQVVVRGSEVLFAVAPPGAGGGAARSIRTVLP